VPLRALLLDFDGTVASSLPALERVYRTFLRDHGREGSTEEFRSLNGPSLPEIAERLKRRHALAGEVAELAADYRRRVRDAYADAVLPAEGALELLRLATSLGVRVALVTSCPAEVAETFLVRHGLDRFFEALVDTTELPRGKPDPAVYLRALDLLGLAPSDALAVEDSASGVEAASGAGLRVSEVGPPERSGPPRGLRDVARIVERECGSRTGATIPMPPSLRIEVVRKEPPLGPEVERRIEAVWQSSRDRGGTDLFDGSLLAYHGYRGGILRCRVEAYKRYVAARADPSLRRELDIRPVGVSGACRVGGSMLFGERSARVLQYPGRLELVPSGGLDAAAHRSDGTVDFEGQILRELREEAGLEPSRVAVVRPFALYLDIGEQSYDICCEVLLRDPEAGKEVSVERSGEYTRLRFVPEERIPSYVRENDSRLVPCSLAMVEALGLVDCRSGGTAP
jgi:HAD superfamily hydrolase (TIGR01509 family)